jgi:hypothetical protein
MRERKFSEFSEFSEFSDGAREVVIKKRPGRGCRDVRGIQYFNYLIKLERLKLLNSRSEAAFDARLLSRLIALLRLESTDDSLLVRAARIACK